eukprot:gene10905-3609_t
MQHYTFTQVDPSKERTKRRPWIDKIPKEHQNKFQNFENVKNCMAENAEDEVDRILKGTGFSCDFLQKKYSKDKKFHCVFDLKGRTMWFNDSYQKLTKRSRSEYLKSNCVENILKYNPDHPVNDFLVNLLKEQPKESIIETSELFMYTQDIRFRSHFERIDNESGPVAAFCTWKAKAKNSTTPSIWNWVTQLPEEQQTQFKKFELTDEVKSKHQRNTERINKLLQGTGYNFKKLEELYSNDTVFHIVFDIKGQSIWNDYLKPNFVDVLLKFNPDHPYTSFFVGLLQDRPKQAKIETSEITLSSNRKVTFRANYERLDNEEGPVGYLSHYEETFNK